MTTTLTELLASAVPVIVGVVSLVVIALTTGEVGAVVSTSKLDVPAFEVFPAASVEE